MRRTLLLCILAVAVLLAPLAAEAGRRAPGDGTLSVQRGRGQVVLNPFRGSVIGRVTRGQVWIRDLDPGDGGPPLVWGCDRGSGDLSERTADPDDIVKLCRGQNLRFRAVGGKYRVTVSARQGMFLSVVGRGRVELDGRGDERLVPDGVYSLNGEPFQSLPDYPELFVLGSPAMV